MPSRSAIDVHCERLWVVAERARARGSLSRDDIAFVRDTVPAALDSFPRITLPKKIRHPGGFTVSGAPVGHIPQKRAPDRRAEGPWAPVRRPPVL